LTLVVQYAPHDEDLLLIQVVPAEKHNVEHWLEGYQFPSEFRNWKHKHWTQWSVAELHCWLYNGNLVDMSSQRLYGGYASALWVFLTVVKLWTVVKHDIDHLNIP
jgi:hypothetical protein